MPAVVENRKFQRVNILGVGVSETHPDSAARAIFDEVSKKNGSYVCLATVNGVMECRKSESLRRNFNRSFMTFPDGMPMVWLGKLKGFSRIARVYGPDFMLKVCEEGLVRKTTHFLYGGREGVVEELKQSLENCFPGIKIRGIYTPPFRSLNESEKEKLENNLNTLQPDIVWVGISSPKQEQFMASMQGVKVGMFIGVGAAFDYHTGRIQESPPWIKSSGFQWLHRLIQEPRRLWYRYLVYNPLFVLKSLLQLTGLKKYPLD